MPTRLQQLRSHIDAVRACTECPRMMRPAVAGSAVLSQIMLIGQAPGPHEAPIGRPFAWTAGKTLFTWFSGIGLAEPAFRKSVYMAAVARCFPGKAASGGDRVPDAEEIARCARHLAFEIEVIRPALVIPVGKLAIAQILPEARQLVDVIGSQRRARYHGHDVDVIPLPHPSGASTWHRMEPGKTLLAAALARIAAHPAWRDLIVPSRVPSRVPPRPRSKELRT